MTKTGKWGPGQSGGSQASAGIPTTPPGASGTNDPIAAVSEFMETPQKIARRHASRVLVTFRCKRNRHFRAMVVRTRSGLVLYSVRAEGPWKLESDPSRVAVYLPDRDVDPERMYSVGGCKCGNVKALSQSQIWASIDEAGATAVRESLVG